MRSCARHVCGVIHSLGEDAEITSRDVSGRPRLRKKSSFRSTTIGGRQKPQIQLLSLPQLDAIQRTLKILDVRLQHVQSNVSDEEKEKADIDHIRRLMSENQVALTSVVTVLASIQEEVRTLRVLYNKQQTNTFSIQPAALTVSKKNKEKERKISGAVGGLMSSNSSKV